MTPVTEVTWHRGHGETRRLNVSRLFAYQAVNEEWVSRWCVFWDSEQNVAKERWTTNRS